MTTAAITRAKWTLPRILLWVFIVAIGVASLAIVALARGEPVFTQHGREHVNAMWLIIASVCVFAVAYRFHSAWLTAKVLTVDEMRATPAITKADGRDFVKTNRWVVFAHHFAAIAGPGPLVGPVLAAQFGYLPGTLWILIGAVLGGAVHDSIILFSSTRRNGRSVGQMVRDEAGPFAGGLAMVSILAILVIIIAVLALVVVKALAHSPWGTFTIACTIPLALSMGVMMKSGKIHMGVITAYGILGLLFAVVGGNWIGGTRLDGWLTLSGPFLAWAIMIYGLLSSSLPVWLLLAPRDYLSSFMKIGVIAFLAVAIIILMPPLKMPAITSFIGGGGPVLSGSVFPFCFITIACAAISGFHSIIASGTTPKIIPNEKDIRVVGYGGMVTEMLVGIVALISACTMTPGEYFAINLSAIAPARQIMEEMPGGLQAAGVRLSEQDMARLVEEVSAGAKTPKEIATLLPGKLSSLGVNISGQDAARLVDSLSVKVTTRLVAEKVTRLAENENGEALYPITAAGMEKLADDVGEKTMIGRTGGAPTFAVGMAHMFAGLFGRTMTKLWYHFAIMFEALFILTTIDAGTRVGRYLVKDFIGLAVKPLGAPKSSLGNFIGSLGFIGMWGYFLYQGVTDPHGGINSLWPIFGVSNQLLAVIGLSLGTTILIKMGRARYIWLTTIPPLLWLISVTFTAGWQLIFSTRQYAAYGNIAEGFFFKARHFKELIARGVTEIPFADTTVSTHTLMVNNYVNTAVTLTFMALVFLVLVTCARLWWRLLSGRQTATLHESEYIRA